MIARILLALLIKLLQLLMLTAPAFISLVKTTVDTWPTDLHAIIQIKLLLLQWWVLQRSKIREIATHLLPSAYYIYTAQKMNLLYMREEAGRPEYNIQVSHPLSPHGLPSMDVKLVASKIWMCPLAWTSLSMEKKLPLTQPHAQLVVMSLSGWWKMSVISPTSKMIFHNVSSAIY